MRASRRWVLNLAVLLGSTALALALVEATLRLVGVSSPSFYTVDEHRGAAHRPGAAGWFQGEGHAFVRINRDGLRDREHAIAKPPGTVRIAVLGDSYTQAVQVPREENFCSVLENELRARGAFEGREVEVINFGVASYGTAQEFLTLRHRVWRYSPDIVLLAFLSLNDVKENARALIREEVRPYFVLEGERLVLDASFRQSSAYVASRSWRWRAKHCVVERSHLLQLACLAKRNAILRRRAAQPGFDEPSQIYHEPTDPAWREAWRVTERLLVAMRDECERHAAGFFVVTLSNAVQVHPDPAVRDELARRLGVPDLFYPERRIQALGARAGFPVLSLAPDLQRYAQAQQTCVHGFPNCLPCDGHWNAAGHRLAGSRIAAYLNRSWVIVETPAPDPAESGALARSPAPPQRDGGEPSAQE